jgi:hypothetical protein
LRSAATIPRSARRRPDAIAVHLQRREADIRAVDERDTVAQRDQRQNAQRRFGKRPRADRRIIRRIHGRPPIDREIVARLNSDVEGGEGARSLP